MPAKQPNKKSLPQQHKKRARALLSAAPPPLLVIKDPLKTYMPDADEMKALNKGGRPTLYTPEMLPRVEELCSRGYTNKEVAAAFGITPTTLYEWREKFPEFALSLTKYRGLADIAVENALIKSALGFTFEEKERERRKIGKDPETGKDIYALVETKVTEKLVQGVPAAQIFYLKNRMPNRYKDKIDVQHGLQDDVSQMGFLIKRRGE